MPLPIASLLRDRFLTLLANGGEELDWSAIGALAAWEAGVGKLSEAERPNAFTIAMCVRAAKAYRSI